MGPQNFFATHAAGPYNGAVPDTPRRVVNALIDWDPATRLYVGVVPGIPGALSRGATPEELQANLKEVLRQLRLKEPNGNAGDHGNGGIGFESPSD